ncbi:MAG: polysaccharide deacetylase family protein [Alphaproteobacteria bacterium]|jgi:poly-beta-1,6-N-acetyl-D-glucosamine N-deacetylase|nr:polysaccharide deacetylase family protein [Alphaproteobacteria bacterium]
MYFRQFIKNTLCALLAGVAILGGMAQASAEGTNAVVIMYHRFGESRYPTTNVTIKQLEAHIEELKTGDYTVLPLPDIIKAMQGGQPLPARTIAISIDDAYLSVFTEAWPRLKAAGFPFTVFVATDPVDQNTSGFMTWAQIRELAEAGVTIGAHTGSHLHMPKASPTRNLEELARSQKRYRDMLDQTPKIFAYPYGESSLSVQAMAKDAEFIAAFGQHSGAFNTDAGMFDLPRFAMNENYAGMDRFRLAINALALPVTDLTPTDPLIKTNNPPAMGFTLTRDVKGLDRLSCFAAHEGRAQLERLGQRRIEVRVKTPFPKGRTRVNCTLPGPDGRWYWFGRQFYRPE